ncbi:hypothetical protein [Chryseobacterium sp.]|uniref:hypothetical protein n=1 Tax=Chryseobacterium sp. TaxID=1871047 RepID=UPI00388E54F2
MKKITTYLFFASIFLSLASLMIMEKGFKEIYPFASWKLFTVPSGGLPTEQRYVLFGIKNNDTVRIRNTPTAFYEANDKALITDTYSYKIENKDNIEINKKKLLIFAKDIAPQFDNYLVFKETYNPKEIGGQMKNSHYQLISKL